LLRRLAARLNVTTPCSFAFSVRAPAFTRGERPAPKPCSAERERADKAISAFEPLAERLRAMAAAKRPWWRRLVG
jgi:hypothetical protein